LSWYLRKDWEDDADGIDLVLLHYTVSLPGMPADWGQAHECRPLEDRGGLPRRRAKVISLPTAVWDHRFDGWNHEYTLHHYFEVFQHGGQWTTQHYAEDIVSRELEFYDEAGLITNICVYWSVHDWEAPTYSPMEEPRFPSDSEFASIRYYAYQDKPRYHESKYHMLREIPAPHRWRARMWAPRGSQVLQQYHIGRLYPEHERGEFFYGPDGVTEPGASAWVHQM
jgi:hypothetical protein